MHKLKLACKPFYAIIIVPIAHHEILTISMVFENCISKSHYKMLNLVFRCILKFDPRMLSQTMGNILPNQGYNTSTPLNNTRWESKNSCNMIPTLVVFTHES